MARITSSQLLTDYSDQSVQYSPYQFLANLGKYVVDHHIGAVYDLVYEYSPDGSLNNKQLNGFFASMVDNLLPVTSAEVGVTTFSEVFEAVYEEGVPIADYDLVLSLKPFGNFPSQGYVLVEIKNKFYLGYSDPDEGCFHLFSFVSTEELLEYYAELMMEIGTDDPEEIRDLINAEEVDSDYQPSSWKKPTAIDPKVFRANTSIYSGYNPILVSAGLWPSQGYQAPPEHIRERFDRAVASFATALHTMRG